MIILQKLKWDNCFSYGEGNEIDLSKSTLTQLVEQMELVKVQYLSY